MPLTIAATAETAGLSGPKSIWSSVKEALAGRLSPGNYKTWIEPLRLASSAEGRLVISGPNSFFLSWVKSHYLGDIREALAAAGVADAGEPEFASGLPLLLEHQPGAPAETQPEPPARPAPSAGVFAPPARAWQGLKTAQPLRMNNRFTFDSFVVGDSNLYAFSAAKALALGDPLGADALFITSDHGLGKSHLSQALGQTLLAGEPGRRVYYLTAEDFTNEMTQALRNNSMEDFKAKFRHNCDVLVLEEVQFLAGKEKIQTELCFTLDCLIERGRKVVFTSPQEPKDIPRLGRSLRSRLSTALVSPIGAPDYETRLNILMRKAKAGGLKVSRQVLEYVADRVTSDVRQLESCLISLKAKTQLLGRPVDIEMAKETLAHMFDDQGEGALNPQGVRTLICRHFQLDVEAITSKDRTAKLTQARGLGIYLSRQLTGRTLSEIGQVFGRTHSSALYAVNKLELQLKKDAKLKGKVEFLSQQLLK